MAINAAINIAKYGYKYGRLTIVLSMFMGF